MGQVILANRPVTFHRHGHKVVRWTGPCAYYDRLHVEARVSPCCLKSKEKSFDTCPYTCAKRLNLFTMSSLLSSKVKPKVFFGIPLVCSWHYNVKLLLCQNCTVLSLNVYHKVHWITFYQNVTLHKLSSILAARNDFSLAHKTSLTIAVQLIVLLFKK